MIIQAELKRKQSEYEGEPCSVDNCVFVGMDENGTARHAHLRSTASQGKNFRQTVEGSDARYCFHFVGGGEALYVFESPIDLLSYITLHMSNIPLNIDWQQILLHFFNFSILVGGLYLLLFKPVKNFMDKREKHYADMESAAVDREKDTEALKAAMAQREAALDAELEEKRAAAAQEAENYMQQQRDAAKAQADKILSDARTAAESERRKIVAEANREAVAIAEDAVEKLLAAQADQAYDAFVNAAEEEEHEH